MKKIALAIVCALLAFTNVKAQYKFPAIDPSILDIAEYPKGAIHDGKPVQIKITYSRPLKKGRDIFSATGLQPYGKVWRVGANESTEIKFYTAVTIGGKQLPAGTYTLFAIPNADHWTIIINSQLDKWGLSYDQFKDKDVMRFDVPVKILDNVQESVAITYTPISGTPNGTNIVIGWDKTAVEIPVIFN